MAPKPKPQDPHVRAQLQQYGEQLQELQLQLPERIAQGRAAGITWINLAEDLRKSDKTLRLIHARHGGGEDS